MIFLSSLLFVLLVAEIIFFALSIPAIFSWGMRHYREVEQRKYLKEKNRG